MDEMTPLGAAEELEKMEKHEEWIDCESPTAISLHSAASYLRAIAAGEYKQVVHAHITGHGYDLHCSNCGASADIGDDYCKSCGALIDGKDDSHE